ncbi:MAG: YceI family protein [Capnocytophaga sp.]|nr:YceI family protein [Capnocytophaga sp.]
MCSKIKLLVGLLVLTGNFALAQATFKLQSNPELKVSGTSSLHDWEMTSNQATGELQATAEGTALTAINALTITMQAESIKSGKNGMDKKAYEALKTDKNKTIKYVLKSASKSGDTWTLTGTLTIAGTSKSVSLQAKETNASGGYALSGSHSFKLTDFGIEPPKAMMGTIKTGDAVAIHFNVNFK